MTSANGAPTITDELRETRRRTHDLMSLVGDDDFDRSVHWFYSPIGWHQGHVAMIEEHWVLVRALGRREVDPMLAFLFANVPENPKERRVDLPSRREIADWMSEIRGQVLEVAEDFNGDAPLRKDRYAIRFALQHEHQHQETMVELLQLLENDSDSESPETPTGRPPANEMIRIDGGRFRMGTDHLHAYDNEKPRHEAEVAPFAIAKLPVTVAEYFEFMNAGGYERREVWSEAGWAWRQKERALCPEYWTWEDGRWRAQTPVGKRALCPGEPVASVSWFEADAYARWVGMRLPTETEWEYVATDGGKRKYPWGNEAPTDAHANFGIEEWSQSVAGLLAGGASSAGVLDLAGQAWEWTSTAFAPYPGFSPFPYDGYSHEHMDGSFYVCRGGSWATQADVLRSTFRNWYPRGYRQGLLGIRLAADV